MQTMSSTLFVTDLTQQPLATQLGNTHFSLAFVACQEGPDLSVDLHV